MKYLRLISIVTMLAGSMWAMAQEYIITKTFTEQRCIEDIPYRWRGQTITTSGKYNDTTKYADPYWGTPGEIEQLNVTFTNHLKYDKHFEIKKGQKVEFRGKTYDKEGTYTDKKPSSTACDTTFTILITISNDYHFYETADICKTDAPYEWRGEKYYYTGEYKKTYRTKDNKNDSIYHLTLNVHIPFEQTKHVTVCEDELPYKLGAQEIYEEGTYTDTLHPAYGCLEIVHVILKIAPRPYTKQEVKFCKNEGYTHGGKTYYDRQTFMDTIRRISGCDSIVETTCIPLPTYLFETRGGHRAGEPYVWDHNGQTYTKDSNYYEFYKTKDGCDSIYALYVTTTYETFVSYKTCQGDTILYHDQVVTDSTQFPIRDTLKSIMGGDSILLVTYQFMPRYYFLERTNICLGDTVEWTGHTDLQGNQIYLVEGGSYFDRKKTTVGWGPEDEGCDSIYEIQVTILPKYGYDTIVIICNDSIKEKPYIWTDAHGKQHEFWKTNADTTIFETLNRTPVLPLSDYLDGDVWYRALSGGCDSTWQMRIITKDCGNDTALLCPGSAVWVNGVKYTKTGDYVQCVQSSIPEACDSICRVHIGAAEPFNSDYYEPVKVCASELPYKWYTKQLSKTGKYDMKLRTVDGCDSIVHIDFTVWPTYEYAEPTRRICRGDTTYINREPKGVLKVWKDTTIRDTLYTQMGCDSIIIYTVNQVRDYFFDKKDHFRKDSIYWWHRDGDSIAITKPGVYFDSCKTVDGCDSVYRITLSWDLPRFYQDSDSVCANDLPYRWHNMEFFRDTTAIDSMKTPTGMDSVFVLKLKVLPKFESDEYMSLCAGQTFLFKKTLVSKSGTYVDTLVAKNGCDSVVRYHINFFPNYLIDEEVRLGKGQAYTWLGHRHDTIVSDPGWYFDSLKTHIDCDSIYRLHVIEDKSFLKGETKSICASDTPYEWHGQFLSQNGTYYDSYEVRPGVDSSYYINLSINPTYLFESTVDLCAGGTYSFFGRTLTESGVYEEVLTSTLGCDSIYRVTINRRESEIVTQKYSICPGELLKVADTMVYNACQFTRTYPSSLGCDSVVKFQINELESYKRISTDTMCEGSQYKWIRLHRPDTFLTSAGTYRDVYPIPNGCDSVFELHLYMYPRSFWDTTIYVCSDEEYTYKGVKYSVSKDFIETYTNYRGCDSVRAYHYKVMPLCSPIQSHMHCKGSSVIIGGRNYTEDGDYRIVVNKDSMYRFSLASYPTYERNITLSPACDSLEYAGEMYYARFNSPTFVVDRYMMTKDSCDSIEHVTMTIYKSSPHVYYKQIIYDYEYMIFGNEYYSTSGTYVHRNHTMYGCDSTLSLELTVIPTEHPGSIPVFYCATSSEPLKVFGKTFRPTKDTIVFDTVFVPYTDLKIIKKAEVTVEEAFQITDIIPEKDVCSDQDLQFNIAFKSVGAMPKKYVFTFKNNIISAYPKIQKDDIDPYTPSVTIKMSGQGAYVRPGIYPYSLKLTGNQCHMNDFEYEGEITVRYPESVMEANWNNVVALFNENHNAGGWVFEPPYKWQVWNRYGEDKTSLVAPSDPTQPYIYSNKLANGDTIVVTLRREGYATAIPSCKFVFQSTSETDDYSVIIAPTTTKRSSYVKLQSNSDGKYQMLDNSGNVYQSGEYHKGEQQLKVPASEGCYLIHLIDDQTTSKTQKIIVY